jgi:hypothetical protein
MAFSLPRRMASSPLGRNVASAPEQGGKRLVADLRPRWLPEQGHAVLKTTFRVCTRAPGKERPWAGPNPPCAPLRLDHVLLCGTVTI